MKDLLPERVWELNLVKLEKNDLKIDFAYIPDGFKMEDYQLFSLVCIQYNFNKYILCKYRLLHESIYTTTKRFFDKIGVDVVHRGCCIQDTKDGFSFPIYERVTENECQASLFHLISDKFFFTYQDRKKALEMICEKPREELIKKDYESMTDKQLTNFILKRFKLKCTN